MVKNKSTAEVQNKIQKKIIDKLNYSNKWNLSSDKITINNTDLKIQIDGIDKEKRVICEVYAHYGDLKPGHLRKINNDILKMLLFEKLNSGKWEKYICVHESVEKRLKGKSWLSEVIKVFGFKIHPFQLTEKDRLLLLNAQKDQADGIKQR